MNDQANQGEDEEAQPPQPPPVSESQPQSQAEEEEDDEEEEEEEPRNEDDELIAKAQKLMEKITSSPENPSSSALHALASLLETQESRYAFSLSLKLQFWNLYAVKEGIGIMPRVFFFFFFAKFEIL